MSSREIAIPVNFVVRLENSETKGVREVAFEGAVIQRDAMLIKQAINELAGPSSFLSSVEIHSMRRDGRELMMKILNEKRPLEFFLGG